MPDDGHRYEQAGCASYWVVDPDPEAPSVIVWQLADGVFIEAGRAVGSQRLAITTPFPVSAVPAELIA